MISFMHHPYMVCCHTSNVEGFGVFATQYIQPDTFLLQYWGKEVYIVDPQSKFIIQFHGRFFDSRTNPGYHRWVNHCCDNGPFQRNARLHMWRNNRGKEMISIVSNRPIEMGEEIFIDYGKKYEWTTAHGHFHSPTLPFFWLSQAIMASYASTI